MENVELWREVAINIDFDPVKVLPASCSPNNRVIATTLAKVVHNIYRFTSLNDFNFDPHIEQFGFQVLIEQSNEPLKRNLQLKSTSLRHGKYLFFLYFFLDKVVTRHCSILTFKCCL
jgi:hypothetical protein